MALGLAIDIGTTNIAGFLINLDKRRDFCSLSIRNSQFVHGFDVTSRLTYVMNTGDHLKLHKSLVRDINNLIFALTKKLRINRKRLEKIIVCGNSVMLHLLFNYDPSGLAVYPFNSKIKESLSVLAGDLGIVCGKDTILTSLPVISAYAGADVVSGILYTGMHLKSSKKILVDLGTNAEIVFGNKDKLVCTSAAAGPAFKSKIIPFGSDIISLVADMLRKGIIDKTGKYLTDKKNAALSQDDIRAFQLAKSAVRSGIEILVEKLGCNKDDISKVLVSGFFGEKIKAADALKTGLMPDYGKNKVRPIGNSALGGAKMVLFDPSLLKAADEIVNKCEHVELSLEKGYQERFLSNIGF